MARAGNPSGVCSGPLLGGSLGVVTSHLARQLGSSQRIVSVEANSDLLDSIRRNVRRNCSSAHLSVVHGAIFYSPDESKTPTSIHLQIGATNTDSSITEMSNNRSVEVPVVTLTEILRNHEIGDYSLICDIEGAEIGMIEKEKVALARCQQLIIELHQTSWNGTMLSVEELCARLESDLHFRLRDCYGPVCVFER